MIRLITGLPGAGKSLRLVQAIKQYLAEGRNVYVEGIDNLTDFGWQACNARRWQDLPDGSVIVVDECQKVWPSRRNGDPPEDIRALSEHRHHGLDFVLCSQHPTMLDSYIRKLVGQHEHVLRQFGMQASRVITWTECQDDPQSQGTRSRGTEALWKYPSELYPLYKSATLHTVKRRIPLRLKLIPVLLLVVVGLVWYGLRSVTSLAGSHGSAKPVAAAAPDALPASLAASAKGQVKYANTADYVKAQVPRVAGMPWSAPIFDERPVLAQPELYCMQMQVPDEPMRCKCYTEQLTPAHIAIDDCHRIAREGIYNPFRQPFQQKVEGQQVAQAAPAAAPVAVATEPEPQAVPSSKSGAIQIPHAASTFRP